MSIKEFDFTENDEVIFSAKSPAVKVVGSFGNGKITISVMRDDGSFSDLKDSYTKPFEHLLEFERSMTFKIKLTGATNPELSGSVW